MSILTRSTASKLQTGYTADRYQAVNTMMRRYNANAIATYTNGPEL